MQSGNPIVAFVEGQGIMMLDGGLATELEARGHDLNDELWSAKLLLDEPEAVAQEEAPAPPAETPAAAAPPAQQPAGPAVSQQGQSTVVKRRATPVTPQ